MTARTYFKATRPDGMDFHTGRIDYATALVSGDPVRHPWPNRGSQSAAYYISVATVPTDCTGMSWPCRLFEVQSVGRAWTPDKDGLPNKRAAEAVRVVRELPAHQVFGPQGEQVVALIERARSITYAEASDLAAARAAAGYAARDAAWDAAWAAARDAARAAAWAAAWDAAGALALRDLIGTGNWTQEHYNTLTRPWALLIGAVHPDDLLVVAS